MISHKGTRLVRTRKKDRRHRIQLESPHQISSLDPTAAATALNLGMAESGQNQVALMLSNIRYQVILKASEEASSSPLQSFSVYGAGFASIVSVLSEH